MPEMIYEKTLLISSTLCDSALKLGPAQTFILLQDGFTQCLTNLGFDGVTLRDRHHAYWAMTKAGIRYYRRPVWNERVTLRCFPADATRTQTQVNTELLDASGQRILTASQAFCALDIDTHRPRRLTDFGYFTEGFPPAVHTELFDKSAFLSGPEELAPCYAQRIYSQHIDMSRHVNHMEYIKMALNCFSTEYLHTREITGLSMCFAGECREGQSLQVFCHQVGEKAYCRILEQQRPVFYIIITFDQP